MSGETRFMNFIPTKLGFDSGLFLQNHGDSPIFSDPYLGEYHHGFFRNHRTNIAMETNPSSAQLG